MINIIDEQTTKEQLNEEYRTYPAVKGELEEKPFYEHRYAPIFFEIPLGAKVLDAGANDGTFMKMLIDKRKCKVTGIDISDVAIEEAKAKGIEVLKADVENLPFEDGSFDVVVLMEVLSHVFDPEKALSEIRRVLKKDGFLLGSCPHKNIQTYAWEDKRMIRQYYTTEELRDVLSKSFDRNWMRPLTGAQFSLSMAESLLANEPCEILFKSGTDILGWDSALEDRSKLRAWMGFFQAPGTVYYRMSGFADKMQELGAEIHYNPYNEIDQNSTAEWSQKITYLPHQRRFTNIHMVNELETILKASDMSIWQITSSQSILLLLTTARGIDEKKMKGAVGKPLITEMDDWMFDIPSYNMASFPYHPGSEPEKVAYEQLKLSDAVIVSTQYLKEKLSLLFPNKPCYIIKNSLDFNIWDNLKHNRPLHEKNAELVRIGYTGCGNHSGDLEIIKKPIMALLEEFPNLEFITLPFSGTKSNGDKEVFADINHPRFIKWGFWAGLSKFPQMVADWELDIGIAPLKDNEFNRVKSNLRWLEYSALHLPTVASDIYPFAKSIVNGKTGIISDSSERSWYENLRSLIVDKTKRLKIGQAAYKDVRKNYDMDKTAKTYMSVLKTIKQDWIREKGKV